MDNDQSFENMRLREMFEQVLSGRANLGTIDDLIDYLHTKRELGSESAQDYRAWIARKYGKRLRVRL